VVLLKVLDASKPTSKHWRCGNCAWVKVVEDEHTIEGRVTWQNGTGNQERSKTWNINSWLQNW
jgi:hypothetical protein